jgi:hypothetical protein
LLFGLGLSKSVYPKKWLLSSTRFSADSFSVDLSSKQAILYIGGPYQRVPGNLLFQYVSKLQNCSHSKQHLS